MYPCTGANPPLRRPSRKAPHLPHEPQRRRADPRHRPSRGDRARSARASQAVTTSTRSSETRYLRGTLPDAGESRLSIRMVAGFLSLILGPSDSWRVRWRLRGRESVGVAEQLCVQLQEGSIGLVDRAVDRATAVELKLLPSTTTAVQELHHGPDAVAGRLCLSSAEYPHPASVYRNTICSSTSVVVEKAPCAHQRVKPHWLRW
jgi:hypothetical protein